MSLTISSIATIAFRRRPSVPFDSKHTEAKEDRRWVALRVLD
jgi:hypothetical protein